MYTFEFSSTVADLLQAESAERALNVGRPLFRWAGLGFGALFLWLAIWMFETTPHKWPRALIALGIGAICLLKFGVEPVRARFAIRTRNAPSEHLVLMFAEDGISNRLPNGQILHRDWKELLGMTDTANGVLFYFSDGMKNWLPERVFASPAHRQEFIAYAQRMSTPSEPQASG